MSDLDKEELTLLYQIVLQIHSVGTHQAVKCFESALKSAAKSAVKYAEMSPKIVEDTRNLFLGGLLARFGYDSARPSSGSDVKLGQVDEGIRASDTSRPRFLPFALSTKPQHDSKLIKLLKLYDQSPDKTWTTEQMESAIARQTTYEQFVGRAKSTLMINGVLTCVFNSQDLRDGEIWKVSGKIIGGTVQSVVTDYASDMIKSTVPYGDYLAPGASIAVQAAVDSYQAAAVTGDWPRVGTNIGSNSISTSAGLGCVALVNAFVGAATGGVGLLAANIIAGTACRGVASYGLSKTAMFGGMTEIEQFQRIKDICKDSGMSLSDKYTNLELLQEDMRSGVLEFRPDSSLAHTTDNLYKLAPKELIDSIVSDASSTERFETRKAGLQHILRALLI